ncbi:uncharacterized protein LOC131875864 [Cryptomeria japonica]|uniref:uncharacterized protein LOC131875864 n=1 Tax=Cryptomeria japonica TaxID=3369 RepID=UPI0027DA632A|nr:uncharacterized protein LOC131875864 [Cryptomeria japonica]
MDHLLQTVSGSEMMSMLDGFFGYNQIGVKQDYQHKTTFTTPWGTFAYNRMPFGLINVGATFQRAMDLSFGDLRNKIIIVYLDDLTVFSKKREEHAYHLECVLQRCRQQGISLNPKKSIFGVTEGKLLGHIVSKEEITKSIVDMMRDNVKFKWSEEGKRAFNQIKSAIADASTLVYPDFSKDFNVYCYASDTTLSAILTQHHNENIEAPISFMNTAVKTILTQQEIRMSKRASWIAKIQEYDIDIKPTKLVHGHGLCKLIAENNSNGNVAQESELPLILFVSTTDEWCVDKQQRKKLLQFFHNEACGGIFSSSVTAFKILRNCYYWPGMFKDADEWWGLDLIGPIHPHSSAGHTHILVATDYFTKWVEVAPVRRTTSELVCDFIKQNILVRYGVPQKIITDNATNFSSYEISAFCYKYGVILSHASDCYPQGNGQAEASNKNIITILCKLVDKNQRMWHKYLYEALWADRTMKKRAIKMSPFELVFGAEARLPIPLELASLKLQEVVKNYEFKDALEKWILYLTKMEEQRETVVDRIREHQMRVKELFDQEARERSFQVGNLVLLWDKQREPKGLHAIVEDEEEDEEMGVDIEGSNKFGGDSDESFLESSSSDEDEVEEDDHDNGGDEMVMGGEGPSSGGEDSGGVGGD